MGEGVPLGKVLVEEGQQLAHLAGKVVEHFCVAVALQRQRFHWTAAGCAPDTEVDSARVERVERAEDLRHLEGGVMRQHDAAGPDADSPGLRADAGQHDLGGGTGQGVHGVVLGHPEAAIAEFLYLSGQFNRILQGLRRSASCGNRGLVQHRQTQIFDHAYWMV